MTTYHEPPLQSRRAVRESERAESATPGPSRAQPTGEPLSYVTQSRPLLPGYDVPSTRGRRVADPVNPAQPREARPSDSGSPTPAFRVRDYSPEGRAAVRSSSAAESDGGVVDYHTQARSAVVPPAGLTSVPPAGPLAAATEPDGPVRSAEPTAVADDPIERTLTRRELRALREAHGIVAVPTASTPVVAPAAAPALRPDAPRGRRAANVPPDSGPTSSVPERLEPAGTPSGSEAADRPPTSDEQPRTQAMSSFDSLFTPRSAQDSESSSVAPQRSAVADPAGIPDASNVAPGPRRVGSNAITTSALVLPSLPGQDISTGEILVTGSIDLPHSLSSMGAHPSQVDESDIDHLLDPGDHQVVSTDSIPIRATRAVSSHTGSRGVIASVKPRGNRALTALIISAAGMAVVVATLLVVALATNVL